MQHVVRPQGHQPVAGPRREGDALAHQTAANAEATGPRLDQQEPELGDLVGRLGQEHAAGDLAVALGDPAALAPRGRNPG